MNTQIYHIHHIVPKHMGGSNDKSNLIKLTVEEHAAAHKQLFEDHGNKFDYIAYMVLSKQIGHEEANYMKLLGPKNWTEDGKNRLREAAKKRSGDKNPFYGKHHTEETKSILREKMSGDNSWIKDIDPSELPYTKEYVLEYPNGISKTVYGLRCIAMEFDTSIANIHATMKRMKDGKIPSRGIFKGMNIYTN